MAEVFRPEFDEFGTPIPGTFQPVQPLDEFGAPQPTPFTQTPHEPQPLDLGDISPSQADTILRQLGLGSIPTQEARLGSALTTLLPQIQGSPAGVRDAVAPQISQIRNNLSRVFDTISQRLGRFGGGQVERERGRAVGAAGGELQNLFARQPAIALAALLQTLSGFSPVLAAQPPLQTASQAVPTDFGALGADLLNLIETGQNVFAGQPAPASVGASPAAPAPGINPFAPQLTIG